MGIAGFTGKLALQNLDEAHTISQTRLLMGTIVNLTLVRPDKETAEVARQAIAACLDCMARLEHVLSRFDIHSQVSRLNQEGVLRSPHPSLLSVLQLSERISDLSEGAFDVTILPLLELYQRRLALTGGLPGDNEIESERRKVNFRRLHIDEAKIAFSEPGMGITLDGIAKGYIVDEGVGRLRDYGFANVLVEAGGDLAASGDKDQGHPWKIGIQDPRSREIHSSAYLELSDRAAATSGDYMQPFSADFSQHHILNPRTGRSSVALASATVIAPRLALADALATALMVMEPAEGRDLAKHLGCETYLIEKVQPLKVAIESAS
jgi:thiamine biosynthesis lipoprotein